MDIKLQEFANAGAGVYYLVEDRSKIASISTNARLRLIFINTRRGPVNNVVYFNAHGYEDFKKVFGDINAKDERNGNFSARSVLTCLENGPALVCNLRQFEDETDKAGFIGFSTKANTPNSAAQTVPYTQLFDTNRLWKSTPNALLNIENKNLLNFANNTSDDISMFVRRTPSIDGYNLTIEKYYTLLNREVPAFVNPKDLVEDTFVDVYIFNTDLTNNEKNKTNENYGDLFTDSGLRQYYEHYNGIVYDALDYLASIADARFVTKVTGSLIPGLVDMTGAPLSIESAITSSGAILCKFDMATAEQIADNFIPEYDNGNPVFVNNGQKRPFAIDLVGHSLYGVNEDGVYEIPSAAPGAEPGDISHLIETDNTNILSYNVTRRITGVITITETLNTINIVRTNEYNADTLVISAFLRHDPALAGIGNNDSLSFITFDVTPISAGTLILGRDGNLTRVNKVTVLGSVTAAQDTTYNLIEVFCDDYIAIGKLNDTYPANANVEIIFDDNTIEKPHSIELVGDVDKLYFVKAKLAYSNTKDVFLTPTKLSAYKLRDDQFTNGLAARQNEILNIMNTPSIVKGLKNLKELKFRYIVDAFESFIEPNYKHQYLSLAKELSEHSHVFCRAIVNEPLMTRLFNSKNPYFKKSPQGAFDVTSLKTGGNKEIGSPTNFLLKPTEGNYYGFFFGPGLSGTYNGIPIIVPPAAAVSKVFLNKYQGGYAWTIAANENGLFTASNIADVEFDFDDEDRKILEAIGYNAIINELGKGLMIYGNKTAQVTPKTSLSAIHVSELIAFIQEQMLSILKDYTFEFNNYQNRLEVKNRADKIMNQILDGGGVYYFQNVCDGTNNTNDIIDNDMGLLDTTIVAAKGAEKWVHRTILERGANIAGFEIL